MSFLDDREDRPGGSEPPGPGSRAGRPGRSTDRQTLFTRRAGAVAVGILALILLIFGIRGCLNAREERAFKDYVREVTAFTEESNQQSEALFGLLRDPGDATAVDLQNNVNGFRVEAEQLVDRAEGADHPDEFDTAQRFLVESLEFRRDGIGALARQLPTALGDEGRAEATGRIAGQMRSFLTSDVIYSQRVISNLRSPLRAKDLLDEVGAIPTSRFLPDIDWLRPTIVADRIARIRTGRQQEAATPGLHGTGLGNVSVKPSRQALAQGGTTSVEVTEDLALEVQVANQGENEEREVTVRVSITGAAEPIELEDTIERVAAGGTATAAIPLAEELPTGRPVKVDIEVEPVPGEKKTDNNKGSFSVTFTEA